MYMAHIIMSMARHWSTSVKKKYPQAFWLPCPHVGQVLDGILQGILQITL